MSPEWKDKVGSDLLVKWPVGTGAKGNDGVALAVRQTANSIGYVEYAQAVQTKLSYASLQNSAGKFVLPDPQSFQAAAASADWGSASDFDLLLTDAPGENAYPIVATVFVLMHKTDVAAAHAGGAEFLPVVAGERRADARSLVTCRCPSAGEAGQGLLDAKVQAGQLNAARDAAWRLLERHRELHSELMPLEIV